jgi:hypothetical protein
MMLSPVNVDGENSVTRRPQRAHGRRLALA